MIIRTNRITFASDTPNSNHNEFKNNTNDFPKLDNFLNAQLYSVSKEQREMFKPKLQYFSSIEW